ncbi:hypothetical protein RKE29_22885 [Streptomyces sp. B1866]|nr:hypothetical protein [Streptomyces sp. B1866]MDT3399456.1 hypothetical protein [Streptomyces sp. B1866]
MDDQDTQGSGNRWGAPDRWQVVIGTLSLLVAIVACVGQFLR